LGAIFSAFEIAFPFKGEQYAKQVLNGSNSQEVEGVTDADLLVCDSSGKPQYAIKAFPETTQQFEEWERRRKRSLHFGLICVFLSAIMQLYPIFFPSSTPPKIKPSNHVQPAINQAT
jgi:hypothetical protein